MARHVGYRAFEKAAWLCCRRTTTGTIIAGMSRAWREYPVDTSEMALNTPQTDDGIPAREYSENMSILGPMQGRTANGAPQRLGCNCGATHAAADDDPR